MEGMDDSNGTSVSPIVSLYSILHPQSSVASLRDLSRLIRLIRGELNE